ncbi:polysaccharide biosynthesis tyrosine autokinase [Paraburkholderia madseniana]|uniref:polysaccharide biosynthesis tyrosine autokinase n=1 Tax=Paraburkholderia madseniana TaxID=2599607 RepID=UPI0038B8E476
MNRPVNRNIEQQEGGFNLAALLDVFVLYRRMMFYVFGVVATVGIAWTFLSAPVYQADILVQVEESSAATTARSLLGDLSAMFDVKSSADAEMQVLDSRLVVANTVDDMQLYINAEALRFPIIGAAIGRSGKTLSNPGLLGVGGYTWGNESVKIGGFDVPPAFEGEPYSLTLETGGHFRLSGPGLDGDVTGEIGHTKVFGTEDGPISLEVESINAKPGARFKLTRQSRLETVDRLQRDLTISQEGKDSDVLRVTLRGTDAKRITDTMSDIARFYVAQNVARKSEEAARSLDFLQNQLPDLRQKLNASEAVFTDLRSKLQSVDMDGEAKMVLQQSAENETQLTQLEQKRSDLASRFNPEHPSIVAVDQQIAILQHQSGALAQRVDRLPEQQRKIVQAERDVKVNTDLYLGLLSNIEQLKLLKAGRIGNVRVIDNAVLADRPVRLRRAIMSAIAVVLAMFIAVATATVRDLLFGGVTDPRDIEDAAGLRVFAAVPLAARSAFGGLLSRGKSARKRRLLAISDPSDPAIESLRSLRTALQFSMVDAKNNVVMFVGPSPSIGKSFVSSNFAAVLAALGKRVVLIDADLRRGHLSETLGGGPQSGFADVISGSIALDVAIRKTVLTNLDFLPTGSRPRNAADFLNNGAVGQIINELSARYDVVVIDTAPLLAVPDALILAPFAAGNIFMLARSGFTKLGEIEESSRRLRQVGVDVSGVILNGIDPHAGRFRYGMKYGSYRYVAYSYERELEPVEQRVED